MRIKKIPTLGSQLAREVAGRSQCHKEKWKVSFKEKVFSVFGVRDILGIVGGHTSKGNKGI